MISNLLQFSWIEEPQIGYCIPVLISFISRSAQILINRIGDFCYSYLHPFSTLCLTPFKEKKFDIKIKTKKKKKNWYPCYLVVASYPAKIIFEDCIDIALSLFTTIQHQDAKQKYWYQIKMSAKTLTLLSIIEKKKKMACVSICAPQHLPMYKRLLGLL